jgi:hypothetical protein
MVLLDGNFDALLDQLWKVGANRGRWQFFSHRRDLQGRTRGRGRMACASQRKITHNLGEVCSPRRAVPVVTADDVFL